MSTWIDALRKNAASPVIKQVLLSTAVLLSIFLFLFFRNPQILMSPQPWAEDGSIFIRQENLIGFPETAFLIYSGYIHLLPRIIAWIAMKFDLSGAMFVMNWAVLLLKVLTFYLIYKSREITSGYIKFSLLAYLILLPFAGETYNNVTNLQWWLIPLMAVLIIRQETSSTDLVFDAVLLLLTGLTGVNSVLFAAPCTYLMLKVRARKNLIKSTIVIVCACIQFYFLYTSGRSGTGKIMYIGGGLDIIDLFVNRIIYDTFVYTACFKSYINLPVFLLYTLLLLLNFYYFRKNIFVCFIYLFYIIYLMVIFYFFVQVSKDVKPLISGGAERYFVVPRVFTFVLLVSTVNILSGFLLSQKNHSWLTAYSCFLLCLLLLKNYTVWFPFEPQYYDDLEKYESAQKGESITVHFPPGWHCHLIKK